MERSDGIGMGFEVGDILVGLVAVPEEDSLVHAGGGEERGGVVIAEGEDFALVAGELEVGHGSLIYYIMGRGALGKCNDNINV